MEKEPDIRTGLELKRRRESLKLTQENMAEKSGLSVPTVSRYERGETRPKQVYLDALIQLERKHDSANTVNAYIEQLCKRIRQEFQADNVDVIRINDALNEMFDVDEFQGNVKMIHDYYHFLNKTLTQFSVICSEEKVYLSEEQEPNHKLNIRALSGTISNAATDLYNQDKQ